MIKKYRLIPDLMYKRIINNDGGMGLDTLTENKEKILKKRVPDDIKVLLYQNALRRLVTKERLKENTPFRVKIVNSDKTEKNVGGNTDNQVQPEVEDFQQILEEPPVPDDEPDLEYPPPPADGSDSEFEVEPQRRKRKAPPILNKRAMRHRQARHEEARQIPYFQRMREEDELLRTIEAGVKRRGDFTNEVRSKRRKLRTRKSVIRPSLNSMETDSSRGKRTVASNEGVIPKRRGIVLSYAKAARNRNLRWTPNAEQKWEEFENDPDNLF